MDLAAVAGAWEESIHPERREERAEDGLSEKGKLSSQLEGLAKEAHSYFAYH
jgi:hypothetical protein